MAGAIIVAKNNGVPLSSVEFDYIIRKISQRFKGCETSVKSEIYSPVDEGLSFISLEEQSIEGFNAFFRAASIAYENEMREQPLSVHRSSWEELMMALRSDPRVGES